ncbi:MAG: hypothetical protein RLY50_108 [Actinomycetota bacterium]|jgi:DNA recombination protein RmuC
METLMIALLAAVLAVLVVLAMRTGRNQPTMPAPVTPPVDVAELRREVSDEISRTVRETVNLGLTEVLGQLSETARRDREEAISHATDTVVSKGSEQFSQRAAEIDSTLKSVQQAMTEKLQALNNELDKLKRTNDQQYTSVEKAVEALANRTENLREVLSSSQKRGQWGERVVEDMLRAAGFIENTNYTKQDVNEVGGRPDYKFLMPPDRVLFMDVKFPLDKYAEHFNAETDALRSHAKTEFVKAVKMHVDALAKRDYVNNAKEEALDYVLMFLPNESISGFVHEADPGLIDYALNKKVVLCSPLTLYAFLVVVRQATDSFHTEKTAADIMQQINKFHKEWVNYSKAVADVKDAFTKLQDRLDSISVDGTRFRKLSVPVRDIEKLRTQQGIPELEAGIADDVDDDE